MRTEETRARVGATPRPARETHTRWEWVEPAAWTEHMLAALDEGRVPCCHAYFDTLGLFTMQAAHARACSPDEDNTTNHRLESRMRESCTSGSEGGGVLRHSPYPYQDRRSRFSHATGDPSPHGWAPRKLRLRLKKRELALLHFILGEMFVA